VATSDTTVRLRLAEADRDRWREAAEQRGVGMSEFIRGCVENVLAGPGYQVTSTSGAAVSVVPSRNTAGTMQCRNQQRHRKGQRCGYCGWTG
jgi:hypothetical protein